MIYLAPKNTPKSIKHFGLLISLNSQREVRKPIWGMDNGRFGKNGVNEKWDECEWIGMLRSYQNIPGCALCTVPDVPYDATATIIAFYQYLPIVQAYGYPVAIVTQNGMIPRDIPWNYIDAVFIGGDDNHKLGQEAIDILVAAKQNEKWTHVGRVNSAKRIKQFWYVDSVDGTTLAIEDSIKNIHRIQTAVDYCQAKKQTRRLL